VSVASVASKAFTIFVANFLSGSNAACRALVALSKTVLLFVSPASAFCALL